MKYSDTSTMEPNQIAINPALLVWARQRAGLDVFVVARKFPQFPEWETGKRYPTLRQLESFAQMVHIPIGYLFLSEPLKETLPVTDFRTLSQMKTFCSPNLLDTLYLCQQRQDWYKEYSKIHSLPVFDFVGSTNINKEPSEIAKEMHTKFGFTLEDRKKLPNHAESLRQFIEKVENSGIMVMTSSIVGSNSHRTLDVEEFRGFVLSDKIAPLIFINGADSKSAQMFTLAHELAHLWLGESGVSNPTVEGINEKNVEQWCNAVAAEFLMPIDALRNNYRTNESLTTEVERLARMFKVSTLVTLRRIYDAGFINKDTFWNQYNEELKHIHKNNKASGGGDFYRTLGTRTGKRFARAVLSNTLEGNTLFRDAFRLLGIKKNETFYTAARIMGVIE